MPVCVCVRLCVLLHSKANPLPTGESPGASYNRRKMSHVMSSLHTGMNEHQSGFSHVGADVHETPQVC